MYKYIKSPSSGNLFKYDFFGFQTKVPMFHSQFHRFLWPGVYLPLRQSLSYAPRAGWTWELWTCLQQMVTIGIIFLQFTNLCKNLQPSTMFATVWTKRCRFAELKTESSSSIQVAWMNLRSKGSRCMVVRKRKNDRWFESRICLDIDMFRPV